MENGYHVVRQLTNAPLTIRTLDSDSSVHVTLLYPQNIRSLADLHNKDVCIEDICVCTSMCRERWRKERKREMKRECAQTSSLNFAASSGILKAFGVNANPWVARTGLETKQEVPGKWFT